ncbi:sugar 3,4-ketoisomerase [Afipia sp. TerB]
MSELAHHARGDGQLSVLSRDDLPFDIVRVFFVSAVEGAKRGMHAHKRCSQFMICTSGEIEVICDDGEATRSFALDRPNLGLLVPPGIWATEIYRAPGSVLTVACDRPYEEDDYIRDHGAFQRYRAAPAT